MKFCAKKYVSAVVLAAFLAAQNNVAYAQGTLRPQDFNKMYYLATQGKVGILREAVHRGLNIDSVNPNGDTGLCIAVKRKNYTAYNTFRMSGANPRHACTYRMYKEYQAFLADEKATNVNKIVGNKESLYYQGDDIAWWPWILGGAAVGGGIWYFTHKKSGGHKTPIASGGGDGGEGGGSQEDEFEALGYGLAGYVTKYTNKVTSGTVRNMKTIDAGNSDAEKTVNSIQFLPNMLSNADYLKIYGKVMENAAYQNVERQADGSGGVLNLGDAAIALAAHGDNAKVENLGNINITAKNGSIAMVASNGSKALNSSETIGVSPNNSSDGSINMIFKGHNEGDAVIGMYADTHSDITNYGKISGIASQAEADEGSSQSNSHSNNVNGEETVVASNSGTILGMSLFDYYTGTDVSQNVVNAKNYGKIMLQAGHNNASDVSISLIGMGSYLDDRFLNGTSNPFFAEKMVLFNDGLIDLAYQKTYNLASKALKLGDGGLIGMRADAATSASNQGDIRIDMQATTINHNNDVAAGMLSVHGASLVNGKSDAIYSGITNEENGTTTYQAMSDVTGGTIQLLNEATSGGVFYGMLAAKGSGTQTNIYKWQPPSVHNYGLIDMQVSNSYAMASFAGGEIVNDGVINLGQENGQSYYTNNRGLYAAGEDITEEVSLVNRGIINVYSEESAAIENAFSGSVSIANEGKIYISNKATNSKAFAGNYSTAINYNNIWYKVGNSAAFELPEGRISDIGYNVKAKINAAAITSSAVKGNDGITKQHVNNEENATLTIGQERVNGVDYGGTFGTAGIQVSKQGSADNKGLIELVSFDTDAYPLNSAMWLDDTTTAEATADNYGVIAVYANSSIGLRNDSESGATATNYGVINVQGKWDYGMAATHVGANIFNGRDSAADRNAEINVFGANSIGMYIKNANGYNYGTINLLGDNTTAFQLDGKWAGLFSLGTIHFKPGAVGIVWYWMTNNASATFSTTGDSGIKIPEIVDGFTLGKVTKDEEGGFAYLSPTSAVKVTGPFSCLFTGDGVGSVVKNMGNVTIQNGATGMSVTGKATAYNDGGDSGPVAVMTIKDTGNLADSNSIGIIGSGQGTTIEMSLASIINVEVGTGVYASTLASAKNGGDINVSGGVGMHITGGTSDMRTSGWNDGSISVTANEAIGAKVVNRAQFTNAGHISASSPSATMDINQYATGIYSDSQVYNKGSDAQINAGKNSIGVYGGTVYNQDKAVISASGANSYGTYGAKVVNNATIRVSGDSESDAKTVGVYGGSLENYSTIEVYDAIGAESDSIDNYSVVKVYGGIGLKGNNVHSDGMAPEITVYGGYGIVGGGSNAGSISNQGGEAGVKVTGIFKNNGSIDGDGVGVEVVDGGLFTNTKKITMNNGTGILVRSGGKAINDGTIKVSTGEGMYIEAGGEGTNNGEITIAGSGYGVRDYGTFTNNGSITFASKKGGNCTYSDPRGTSCSGCHDTAPLTEGSGPTSVSAPLLLGSQATFINNGTVNLEDIDLDLSEGNYVLGKNGTYQAASFKGDVLASSDIVKDGFEDTYTTENAFVGENNGLTATSQSYLFDAEIEDKDEAADIKLTRKSFNDLVEEQDLANFFETNYQLQHNEKMYQSIKSAATQEELNEIVESESGKKFYANLPRENMAVLRGIHHGEQQRILEDGLNGATIGANYFRTGKDGNGDLSEYADDVYSATLGYGGHLNRNWSMGASLTAAYADSDYDDIHSKRNNTIVMAFMPILYQNNRFKYLAMPSVGVGYGEYERHANSGNYKADTFDLYYGLYNHAEYSIDMKVAELVAEAELNLQGVNSDTAKEKGGLNLESNDSVSLEAGVGLKLRKRIQLAKQRELMLAVGTKYYHEMLDPYKSLTIGMTNSPVNYKLKGYDEDKNRLRTAAEAMYKDGHFAVSAEIAHNAEKESNVEGGLGVRYNF